MFHMHCADAVVEYTLAIAFSKHLKQFPSHTYNRLHARAHAKTTNFNVHTCVLHSSFCFVCVCWFAGQKKTSSVTTCLLLCSTSVGEYVGRTTTPDQLLMRTNKTRAYSSPFNAQNVRWRAGNLPFYDSGADFTLSFAQRINNSTHILHNIIYL